MRARLNNLCPHPLRAQDELIGTYYPTLFSLPAQVQRFGSVLYNQ
jgi:hypothetical protein